MADNLLPNSTRKFSAKGFKDELEKLAEAMRARIEVEVAGFDPDEQAKAQRIKKALDLETGFKFFAETYFPHYLTKAPSLLHNEIFKLVPQVAQQTKGAKELLIAPRGSAKSTLISMAAPIWLALVGLTGYTIIAMDAYAQAALALEAIKAELEENPRLAYDFPDLVGKGRLWREGEITLRNGVRIESVGAGMKLRGRRHGAKRPDFVVLDDIENDENVRSPEQRDKLEQWILKAVSKLGQADGSMKLFYIGTVLHHDAVIIRMSKKPGWHVTRFKALMQFPDDLALWDRWEEVFRNEDQAAAHRFYLQHKAAMDEGVVLNWPAMQSLEQLMMQRAESRIAFASEQQGEPVSEDAPFKDLTYWAHLPEGLLYFGAVDPSLGKAGKSRDPSAILIGALDRSGRAPKLYVVEASIKKRLPSLIIADVIRFQKQYKCQLWFFEAVQFQEFFRTVAMEQGLAEGVYISAIAINHTSDKKMRIESLEPAITNGSILFHSSQTTLIEQLTHWPAADHDDGPDALEMLFKEAIGRGAVTNLDDIHVAATGHYNDLTKGWRL